MCRMTRMARFRTGFESPESGIHANISQYSQITIGHLSSIKISRPVGITALRTVSTVRPDIVESDVALHG